jgi:hypothetical protein
VFVPEGQSCTLTRATVSGSVLARNGSRLRLTDTRVDNNIDGVEARSVQVRGGSLGGSIQIADGGAPRDTGALVIGTVLSQGNIQVLKTSGAIIIESARLDKGNIKVEENAGGGALRVAGNIVAQNVEVNKNAGSASKIVRNNRVQQALKCKENTLPFIGGPNSAGDVEGQCTR